jgi:hypothetical protein
MRGSAGVVKRDALKKAFLFLKEKKPLGKKRTYFPEIRIDLVSAEVRTLSPA